MKVMTKFAAVLLTVGCLSEVHAEFSVGFGSVDVTPPLGTELSGYSEHRASS